MSPLVNHLKQHHYHPAIVISTGYLGCRLIHAVWVLDTTALNQRRYALENIHCTTAKSLIA